MWLLDIFKIPEMKEKIKELSTKYMKQEEELKALRTDKELIELEGLRQVISGLEQEKIRIKKRISSLNNDLVEKNKKVIELDRKIINLNCKIIDLDEQILLESFGLYKPKYDLIDSGSYVAKLNQIREKEKEIIKANLVLIADKEWYVKGDPKQGQKLTASNKKMATRALNIEIDAIISKVNYSNILKKEEMIDKVVNQINKLNHNNALHVNEKYISLKKQELFLCYEYAQKQEEEKEEQRAIKAQMREEEKVRREIEIAKEKLRKEKSHLKNALNQAKQAQSQYPENEKLQARIIILENKLEEMVAQESAIISREANIKMGYVYIISNIGAFGENVYKIGMTRRLEPLERIKELGSASVPFHFDVHAMIFSHNAIALENDLHKIFADKRVNLVSQRKEFFYVTIDEIENVVKTKFDNTAMFKRTALAQDFRESKRIRENTRK